VVVATYLEQYLAEIADIKHRLKSLSTGDFDILEVKQLISIAGLRTEHFLRAAVVPSTSFKDDFAGVINALKSHGISKELRQDLHQLRELYNDVKHNSEFRPSISDALQRLSEAESFASGLHGTSIGKVHFPISRRFHRILWVAGWDHYIGGDTEVHILFPSDDSHAPSVDCIHIAMNAWNDVKQDLNTLGTLSAGPEVIPHHVYETFRSEGDFHDAFSFEGEYRDIVSTLAKHEFRVEGLIEPMHREDTTQSMMQAFALGAMDVADAVTDPSELPTAIYVQVINLYAVSPDWTQLHQWCEEFGDFVGTISEEQRAQLSGPVWLSGDAYRLESSRALAKHKWLPILISSKLVMCLGS